MMKKNLSILTLIGILSLILATSICGTAFSATASKALTCGSLQAGTTNYKIAVAISEVVKKHTDINMTILPQTGQTGYLRLMNTGKIQLANGDGPQMRRARLDLEPYTGNAPPLRCVFISNSGLETSQVIVTGRDTDIFKREDLKGRKVSTGYLGSPSLQGMLKAQLANANLMEADVNGRVAASFAEGLRFLIDGRTDAAVATVRPYPLMQELEAARGIRILTLNDSPEAIERAKKVYPGVFIVSTKRNHPFVKWVKEGVPEEFKGLGYSFMIVAGKDLDQEPVYEMVKCVFNNYKELGSMLPPFKVDFVPERMLSTLVTVPYHNGAIRYFKEAGLWTTELENRQKELIAENPDR